MRKAIAILGFVAFGLWSAAAFAANVTNGICTSNIGLGTTAITIVAANDQGSYGRKQLCMQNTTTPTAAAASTIWCTVGGTAIAQEGIQLTGGFVGTATVAATPATVFCFPPAQQAAKTFPMTPNGQVSCIGSAASLAITVCDY